MPDVRKVGYSVPFTLIGQTVEVRRRDGHLQFLHRGTVIADHEPVLGKYQVRSLPEHGPGAIARTARRLRPTGLAGLLTGRSASFPEVECRDLAVYEALSTGAGAL